MIELPLPAVWKLGVVVGSGVLVVMAQISELIPADPTTLLGQSVFVSATLYASRLVVKAVKEAQAVQLGAKDARISTLEKEIEYLQEELAVYRTLLRKDEEERDGE